MVGHLYAKITELVYHNVFSVLYYLCRFSLVWVFGSRGVIHWGLFDRRIYIGDNCMKLWLLCAPICNILTFDPAVNQKKRCIRSKISRYNLDRGRVEFGAIATPTGSMWVSNNYITRCHRQLELVGVSLLEFELQFEAVRTSSQQKAWSLRTPDWAAPAEWEKKCC